MNLFIAKRVFASFFVALVLFALSCLYYAVQQYDVIKKQLIETHFFDEKNAAQLISQKLLQVDEHISHTASSLTELIQSNVLSSEESSAKIFQYTWGEKRKPQLKPLTLLTSLSAEDPLQSHYQLIKITLNNVVENPAVENSFLVKQVNKFEFEYIEQGKQRLPKKALKWFIHHGKYLDFSDHTGVIIPVLSKNSRLKNYVISPLFDQKGIKYFLISELASNVVGIHKSILDKFNASVVMWEPISGYIINTNLAPKTKKGNESKTPSAVTKVNQLPPPYKMFTNINISQVNLLNQLNGVNNQSTKEHKTVKVDFIKTLHNKVLQLELYSLGDDSFRVLITNDVKPLEQKALMGAGKIWLQLFLLSTFVVTVFTLFIVWLLGIPVSNMMNSIERLHFGQKTKDKNISKGWEVWFSLLKQTGKENKALQNTLTHNKHDLDEKVNQRTQKLLEETNLKDRDLALNRAMMNTIPEMLFYKGVDNQYLGCNSAYEKFIGLNEHNIINKTSHDLFEFNRAKWTEDNENKVINNRESIVKQRWARAANGEASLILWFYSPIISSDDKVLGVLGFGRDITDQYNNLHELEKAVSLAEKANAVKGEFIANISHEIRTPMNSIIGMLELLDGINSNPTQKSFISIAEDSAKNLLTVINNILDFSKGNVNKLQAEFGLININDILNNAFANSLSIAMDKQLILDIAYPAHFPTLFISDEVKLTQIFTNLIGNAVKFTQQGSISVDVTQLPSNDNTKQKIQFKVKDTGIGIAESELQSVFDAFSQADSSVTREYGGTGLGLTIVYQLVKLLGGEITLESKPSQGTTFSLVFDFDKVEQQPNIESSKHQFIYCSSTLEIDSIINQHLQSVGISPIKMDLHSEHSIETCLTTPEHQPHVLLCTVELIDQLPKQIVDRIYSGNIRLQPIAFSLQTCHNLSFLPHLPLLTAPINTQVMLSNLQLQHFIYPNNNIDSGEKLKGVSVLIVEDDEVNQKVLMLILEAEGAKCTLTKNGKDALIELEQQSFDLVITDIQMPVMDGLSLTGRIRLMDGLKTLPIIAMSAHSEPEEVAKSVQAGIDQHLTKPIDKHDLILAVLTFTQPELMKVRERLQNQIDVHVLYKQVNQSIDNMLVILDKFYLAYFDRVDVLLDDFNQPPTSELMALLHNFKGALGNIGANKIHQLTKELEQQIKSEQVLQQSITNWQQAVNQLFNDLRAVLY